MKKAVGIIAAAALSLAASQAAMAADIGVRPSGATAPVFKAAPAMVRGYDWTGFYVGGNIGYSWGKAETDVAVPGFTVTAVTTTGTLPVDIPGGAFSESLKPSGLIGGGQIGWNSQFGNWVFGLEVDFQGSGQKDDLSRIDVIDFTTTTGSPLFDVLGTATTSLEARLKWFGTARGRIGYAWDGLLVYGTGGLAYGKFEISGVNTVSGAATCVTELIVCVAPIATPFSLTTALNGSKNKAGWTLGGGLEGAAFAPNWTWKVEYLYLDFGKFDHTFTTVASAAVTGGSGLVTTSTRVTDHIVRFGVNYRFAGGKGPVVARW